MTKFYKGVAAGTHLSVNDLRTTGLGPRSLRASPSPSELIDHIVHGTTKSCYISLTRSYGVAKAYALTGTVPPSATTPGYVYEIELSDPLPPGLSLVDPIWAVADQNKAPLVPHSYHHDGDQNFILGVVDPIAFGALLTLPAPLPPGSGALLAPPKCSTDFQALVRALRDAEILVSGNIPAGCFTDRHVIT